MTKKNSNQITDAEESAAWGKKLIQFYSSGIEELCNAIPTGKMITVGNKGDLS